MGIEKSLPQTTPTWTRTRNWSHHSQTS